MWKDGKTINLGSLGGVLYTNPFAINDRTQVTGTADLPGDLTSHAFLWQNGVMTDLGTLPGDYYSVGYSINNRGQVVGQSCDANFNCRAVLWQNGKITDLNTLIPSTSPLYLYLAATIDDFGVIVGYASDQTANTSPAFVAIPKLIFGSLEHTASRSRAQGLSARTSAHADSAKYEKEGSTTDRAQMKQNQLPRCAAIALRRG